MAIVQAERWHDSCCNLQQISSTCFKRCRCTDRGTVICLRKTNKSSHGHSPPKRVALLVRNATGVCFRCCLNMLSSATNSPRASCTERLIGVGGCSFRRFGRPAFLRITTTTWRLLQMLATSCVHLTGRQVARAKDLPQSPKIASQHQAMRPQHAFGLLISITAAASSILQLCVSTNDIMKMSGVKPILALTISAHASCIYHCCMVAALQAARFLGLYLP